MEDIRIYDFEFNLLHIENDIITSNWTIYFNDIGTFEAHFDLDSDIVPVLMENEYLIAVQGQKQAIITGKIADRDFALFGRTVNWILTRRVMTKFRIASMDVFPDPEIISRYIVTSVFDDVENFVLGDRVYLEPIEDFWRNSSNSAFDVIKDCLDLQGAGHSVVLDIEQKRWVFNVLKGKSSDLIISKGNNNAHNLRYTEDLQNEFSGGWFRHEYSETEQWNASSNTPLLLNNKPENYAKKYVVTEGGTQFSMSFAAGDYIYCNTKNGAWNKSKKDIGGFDVYISGEKNGIYKWDGVLAGNVESEALSSFKSKKRVKKSVAQTIDIFYEKDYSLGDTVTFQLEFGEFKKTVNRKIIGVSFWYENNNIGEKPIFKEDNDEQLQY